MIIFDRWDSLVKKDYIAPKKMKTFAETSKGKNLVGRARIREDSRRLQQLKEENSQLRPNRQSLPTHLLSRMVAMVVWRTA